MTEHITITPIVTPAAIFSVSTSNFDQLALAIFKLQSQHCDIYKTYLSHLQINPSQIKTIQQIPFLPIEFFKTHRVLCKGKTVQKMFTSSGTNNQYVPSRHFVHDVAVYEQSFITSFRQLYGSPNDYAIIGLLPSYLEREGSSLIYMVSSLIKQSRQSDSGFYLYNHNELFQILCKRAENKQKTILFGVTFALLDFVEKYKLSYPELIIVETGGMKGKRKELVRTELHKQLMAAFGVSHIHSEYGMTELLSQAYSHGNGLFHTPSWMRILIRELNDPFSYLPYHSTGGINVIDFANIYSCSFIATQDLGKLYPNNTFEVLGRFDESELRGCNLLMN